MITKKCKRCLNDFIARINSVVCKSCRRAYKYEQEKLRCQDPKYRERRNKSCRLYASRNKEKLSEKAKKWRKNNRRKCCQYVLNHVARNPEKQKIKREKQKLREYGLTIEDYNKLLEIQNNVCAICSNKCITGRKLAIDHNHETGLIRGLLCTNCNQGIGKFKENIKYFYKAIEYLKFHNNLD